MLMELHEADFRDYELTETGPPFQFVLIKGSLFSNARDGNID